MKTIQKMKDAEEKARAEAELKAKMEAKVVKLQGKVRLLESECIQSISQAREEGKQEADILSSSDMFVRSNTPLPYPDAGLKESDDEEEDDDEEDDETEKAGTEQET
uniref:Uncharacterized protein n=1 Tax=Fagus sylvatica TaxID=28930 RepID=A0A2N9EQ94_FAGSY